MAKQQVYKLENGSTLVYQKQSAFNGYSFVIGFRGGSQLDGKYKGLSHLLEHLLFRTPNPKANNILLDNIVKYTVSQNATTTQNSISVEFSTVYKNVDAALDNCMSNLLTRKKFTKEQIAREIEIVKHEINMVKDEEDLDMPTALDCLIENLVKNPNDFSDTDILGNSRTLNMVTPEILTNYVKKYFNLDNLIVSVTTNKSIEDVVELCNKHIYPKLKNASSPKYIVPAPKEKQFLEKNLLVALPDDLTKSLSICLLLRERSGKAEDINLEYAYDIIEEYLINHMGGMLWDSHKIKNQLVYLSALYNLNFDTVKLKAFTALTTAPKMRKTISEICKIIREIGLNGVPKEKFEMIKNVLCDTESANLNKLKKTSAAGNFYNVLFEKEFIDYKKVNSYIQKMTWEEFNQHIMPIYSAANVSCAIQGNFDARKCYTLIEIEKMLGNYSHVEFEKQLNLPRIEETPIVQDPMQAFAKMLGVDSIEFEYETENTEEKKSTPPQAVTIDNEVIK